MKEGMGDLGDFYCGVGKAMYFSNKMQNKKNKTEKIKKHNSEGS